MPWTPQKKAVAVGALGAAGLIGWILLRRREDTRLEDEAAAQEKQRLTGLRQQAQAGQVRFVAVRVEAIRHAFKKHGGSSGLGPPTTGVVDAPRGGVAQAFDTGRPWGRSLVMLAPKAKRAFAITRGFLQLYEQRGGPTKVGYPLEDARTVVDQWGTWQWQNFEHETFKWRTDGLTEVWSYPGPQRLLARPYAAPKERGKKKTWIDDAWDFTKEHAGDIAAGLYVGTVAVSYGALVVTTGGAALTYAPGIVQVTAGNAAMIKTGTDWAFR